MALSPLARSVRATLEYFDLFDYPLTLLELLRYRYRFPDEPTAMREPAASSVVSALGEIGAGERDGFWHLSGRGATIATRERRFRLSEQKFRKVRRLTSWMRLLPSIRMIAVCNSLALANAGEESDIDLFVVTRPGTLWITRLITVGALTVFGMRPSAKTHADRVCMSFFVSEDALALAGVAIRPDDTYLRYWIASLLPAYDAGGVMDAFLSANAWVEDRVPGARAPRRRLRDHTPWYAQGVVPVLRALDAAARRIQERHFPPAIRDAAKAGSGVVVSNEMLKFHVADARKEFACAFQDRVSSFV